LCAPISTAPAPKKTGEDQKIGRSRGGLSTKIHALVDALGNPIGFFLTGGEAHDLEGADHLLPTMQADTLIADRAFDADARVLEPLAAAGKTAVIPPRTNRSSPRDYDRQLYAARHLIENFFAKIKQFRAIATRYERRRGCDNEYGDVLVRQGSRMDPRVHPVRCGCSSEGLRSQGPAVRCVAWLYRTLCKRCATVSSDEGNGASDRWMSQPQPMAMACTRVGLARAVARDGGSRFD
jgi:transposase